MLASDGIFYLLGNDEDHRDHEALFLQLSRLGYEGTRIHPHQIMTEFSSQGAKFFVDGEEIRPALVLGWVYEELLLPGMNLLNAMERSGIPVINTAQTLFCGQNKYLNSEALHRHGIPHLPVISGYSSEHLPEMVFPLVMKPIVGASGRSVVRVDSKEALQSLIKVLAGFQQYYYLQPYVEKPGRDIRVTCVNFEAVHAVYRYAPEGTWVTNLSGGGRAEKAELTTELAEIAERAAQAMGAMIAGVDIMENPEEQKYYVLEVNTCPNFQLGHWLPGASTLAEERLAGLMVAVAREKGRIE